MKEQLNDTDRTCDTLYYAGLGDECRCGQRATYLLDAGTVHELALCEGCAAACHPSRLTRITIQLR